MSKQTKYLLSGGLAFTEQKDMNKLSKMAAQGWLLDSFAFLGFHLRKGMPQQLIYSVDYNRVKEDELPSYLGFFEASGWTRVCSSGDIHIFAAAIGTKPIYSDQDSTREKYKKSMAMLTPFLLVPLLTLVLLTLLQFTKLDSESIILKNILIDSTYVGVVLSVPILMTFTSFFIRLKRVK